MSFFSCFFHVKFSNSEMLGFLSLSLAFYWPELKFNGKGKMFRMPNKHMMYDADVQVTVDLIVYHHLLSLLPSSESYFFGPRMNSW